MNVLQEEIENLLKVFGWQRAVIEEKIWSIQRKILYFTLEVFGLYADN